MSEHDELNQKLFEANQAERKMQRAFQKLKVMDDSYGDEYDEHDPFDDENKFLRSYVHWTTSDGRLFVPAAKTTKSLKPGVYEIDASPNIGIYFEKIPVRTEGLVRFPDTNSDKVVAEIQRFWDREAIFSEYGLVYKRGILLYGPPGSGKSCTVQLIMEHVVNRGGVVIKFTEPEIFIDGMRILRQIQPDTAVVTIMEDIDSTLERFNESEILNILDGVNEVRKTVFIATTNYPERLGARIVNRPSRFDKRYRIGYPSPEARKIYLEHLIANKNGKDQVAKTASELGIDLKKWVKDTDGLSLAHLKELFVAVIILEDPYKEAVETLKSMKEYLEDKDYDNEIGFHVTRSDKFYN